MARAFPLPGKRNAHWTPLQRQTWLANRRHHRLAPAPVLRAAFPDKLAWDWDLLNPYKWNVWTSSNNGASYFLIGDYWGYGDARRFAPDGGGELYYIVGVDVDGNEITRRSNVIRPDDALYPAPVLRPEFPDKLVWDWPYMNPYKWNVWMSLNNGATYMMPGDYWGYGDARRFAPDGGGELYYIVGVDAAGNEITEHSNVIRPDDAPYPAPVLRSEYPDKLVWDWSYPNPYKWNVWMSLNNGASYMMPGDYWGYGDARRFAPDGGGELYYIVGVDASGHEVTEHSNVIRPDDIQSLSAYPDLILEFAAVASDMDLNVIDVNGWRDTVNPSRMAVWDGVAGDISTFDPDDVETGNGLPAVRFYGGRMSMPLIASLGDFTAVIVCSLDTGAISNAGLNYPRMMGVGDYEEGFEDWTSDNTAVFCQYGPGDGTMNFVRNGAAPISFELDVTPPTIYVITKSGGTVKMFIKQSGYTHLDGYQGVTDNNNLNFDTINLGGNSNEQQNIYGCLWHAAMWSRAMDATEINDMVAYLSNRYGIN